jgi:PAT family acetyl-CoA transporter-like MFS transporter 1
VGQKIGYFLSTSLFVALHSSEFCNTYLRGNPIEAPILTLSKFMYSWSLVQVGVTLYIAFLIDEGDRVTEGEKPYTLKQVFIILGDVVKNPNI